MLASKYLNMYRISELRSASSYLFAVYKSDNSNGLFGLASNSQSRTVGEGNTTMLEVERTLGLAGAVRVSWQVSLASISAPAVSDFSPASGTIDFDAGEISQVRDRSHCWNPFIDCYFHDFIITEV